jgi:hypothetical protein
LIPTSSRMEPFFHFSELSYSPEIARFLASIVVQRGDRCAPR